MFPALDDGEACTRTVSKVESKSDSASFSLISIPPRTDAARKLFP